MLAEDPVDYPCIENVIKNFEQLQIDDLIIIPNNISSTPPEGGSALQNLAKIASRYQNTPSTKDVIEVSAPKKAKVEEQPPVRPTVPTTPSTATPSAASLAALASMNPMTMTPAQQQSVAQAQEPAKPAGFGRGRPM